MLFCGVSLAAALALAAGCVMGGDQGRFRFFQALPSGDPFVPLIDRWQEAQRMEASATRLERLRGAAAPGLTDSELARTYSDFSLIVRQKIVDQVVEWVQARSAELRPPAKPAEREVPLDTMTEKGEGRYESFEALTFSLLRARGFKSGEIFRAILRRGDDDVYHRVTLWFAEDGPADPYVLDPTGWVTRDVQPISEIAPWQPVRLFDEDHQYLAGPSRRR